MTPPLISLEEHWFSKPVFDSFDNTLKKVIQKMPGVLEKLFDAGDLRLKDMDAGGISLQVMSHCAAEDPSIETCRAGNDQLAQNLAKGDQKSKRLAAFAVLPMLDPKAAAGELERTVKEYGFVGALVDNKTRNGFCEGGEYDVLWQKAEELDVPIYLHPTWPTEVEFEKIYSGNYSQAAAGLIGGAITVFDKFTKLKIIIGHFGEMIPFMLDRIRDQEAAMGKGGRSFRQVYDENIWITTAGVWSVDPMRCILANTKIDHILYSVDYPFVSNERGLECFKEFEKSGLVSVDDLDLIAYKNAEKLLGVNVA